MMQGGVDIWRISLDRPVSEVTALHALLDPVEQSRAAMFRADRDRIRFVVARGAVRRVLAEYTGLEPHALPIIIRPGGKPVLGRGGDCERLHFNLSHSGSVALCAIADREVGVDIEQLKHHDDMDRVARHFFSREEAETVYSLSGIDRTRFFFRTWVRKEAYIKATGEGLARNPATFTVNQPPSPGVTLHTPDGSSRIDDSFQIFDLTDIGDAFAALSIAGRGAEPRVRNRE